MRKPSAKKHTELLPAPPPRHLAVAAAVAGHSDAYCCFNGPHSSRTSRSKAVNVATKFNAQGGTSKSAKSDTNMQKLAEHVTIDDADMQDDNASAEAERARHQERKEYFATLQEAAKRFDRVLSGLLRSSSEYGGLPCGSQNHSDPPRLGESDRELSSDNVTGVDDFADSTLNRSGAAKIFGELLVPEEEQSISEVYSWLETASGRLSSETRRFLNLEQSWMEDRASAKAGSQLVATELRKRDATASSMLSQFGSTLSGFAQEAAARHAASMAAKQAAAEANTRQRSDAATTLQMELAVGVLRAQLLHRQEAARSAQQAESSQSAESKTKREQEMREKIAQLEEVGAQGEVQLTKLMRRLTMKSRELVQVEAEAAAEAAAAAKAKKLMATTTAELLALADTREGELEMERVRSEEEIRMYREAVEEEEEAAMAASLADARVRVRQQAREAQVAKVQGMAENGGKAAEGHAAALVAAVEANAALRAEVQAAEREGERGHVAPRVKAASGGKGEGKGGMLAKQATVREERKTGECGEQDDWVQGQGSDARHGRGGGGADGGDGDGGESETGTAHRAAIDDGRSGTATGRNGADQTCGERDKGGHVESPSETTVSSEARTAEAGSISTHLEVEPCMADLTRLLGSLAASQTDLLSVAQSVGAARDSWLHAQQQREESESLKQTLESLQSELSALEEEGKTARARGGGAAQPSEEGGGGEATSCAEQQPPSRQWAQASSGGTESAAELDGVEAAISLMLAQAAEAAAARAATIEAAASDGGEGSGKDSGKGSVLSPGALTCGLGDLGWARRGARRWLCECEDARAWLQAELGRVGAECAKARKAAQQASVQSAHGGRVSRKEDGSAHCGGAGSVAGNGAVAGGGTGGVETAAAEMSTGKIGVQKPGAHERGMRQPTEGSPLRAEVSKLESSVSRLEASVSNLEASVLQLESSVSQLESSVAGLEARSACDGSDALSGLSSFKGAGGPVSSDDGGGNGVGDDGSADPWSRHFVPPGSKESSAARWRARMEAVEGLHLEGAAATQMAVLADKMAELHAQLASMGDAGHALLTKAIILEMRDELEKEKDCVRELEAESEEAVATLAQWKALLKPPDTYNEEAGENAIRSKQAELLALFRDNASAAKEVREKARQVKWWCARWRSVYADPEGGYPKPLELMRDKELLEHLTPLAMGGGVLLSTDVDSQFTRRLAGVQVEEATGARRKWRETANAAFDMTAPSGWSSITRVVEAAAASAVEHRAENEASGTGAAPSRGIQRLHPSGLSAGISLDAASGHLSGNQSERLLGMDTGETHGNSPGDPPASCGGRPRRSLGFTLPRGPLAAHAHSARAAVGASGCLAATSSWAAAVRLARGNSETGAASTDLVSVLRKARSADGVGAEVVHGEATCMATASHINASGGCDGDVGDALAHTGGASGGCAVPGDSGRGSDRQHVAQRGAAACAAACGVGCGGLCAGGGAGARAAGVGMGAGAGPVMGVCGGAAMGMGVNEGMGLGAVMGTGVKMGLGAGTGVASSVCEGTSPRSRSLNSTAPDRLAPSANRLPPHEPRRSCIGHDVSAAPELCCLGGTQSQPHRALSCSSAGRADSGNATAEAMALSAAACPSAALRAIAEGRSAIPSHHHSHLRLSHPSPHTCPTTSLHGIPESPLFSAPDLPTPSLQPAKLPPLASSRRVADASSSSPLAGLSLPQLRDAIIRPVCARLGSSPTHPSHPSHPSQPAVLPATARYAPTSHTASPSLPAHKHHPTYSLDSSSPPHGLLGCNPSHAPRPHNAAASSRNAHGAARGQPGNLALELFGANADASGSGVKADASGFGAKAGASGFGANSDASGFGAEASASGFRSRTETPRRAKFS